jgi:hypothetical protein
MTIALLIVAAMAGVFAVLEKRLTIVALFIAALLIHDLAYREYDKKQCAAIKRYLNDDGEIKSVTDVSVYVDFCREYPFDKEIK